MKKGLKKTEVSSSDDKAFPLPIYATDEDIYENDKEVSFAEDDEENVRAKSYQDLDVPGAESDDVDEGLGEEDEENNYYSLGGDDHDDLEETNEDLVEPGE